MKAPCISVVMVTCNVERFLAEAIESILGQTFTDFELIMVDFGSTDKTKAIGASYASKDSRLSFHEIPNCCLAQARNAACSLARGQYIAIMDADDISVPDRLQREIAFLEEHPEVGLLGGITQCIDASGAPVAIRSHDFPSEDSDIRLALASGCPFCQPTVMIRKEAFVRAGGYRSAFAQAEDYDLWLRIAEHFQCANLKQVVLKYRIHPYQVSIRRRSEQTLCVLAAQASAAARKNGAPDPLSSFTKITPAALVMLGISEATQERKVVNDFSNWIRNMSLAGENSVALDAALEIVETNWAHAEPRQIADLHMTIAGLYWKQQKYLRSFLAGLRAAATRPEVVGRPLKPLLERIGLA
jgi:GT2 family glycosyltransferase